METTRPAVVRMAPQTEPRPPVVSPGTDAIPTTAFPIPEAARRIEARIVRDALRRRRRP